MASDQDSWMSSALGIDIGGIASKAESVASSVANTVSNAASSAVDEVKSVASSAVDTVKSVASTVESTAPDGGVASGTRGGAPDTNAAVAAALPGAAVTAAVPAPAVDPGLLEEFEEGVKSGFRAVEADAPVVAEDAAATGLIATAAAAVGPVAVGAVIVGGLALGVGLAVGVPTFLEHADEENQKTDPDEAKPDGGISPTAGPDGLPGQPIDPKEEVETAIHTGDWANAAELLNGFSADDISQRLAKLTPEQIAAIHDGALKNPRVGPQSQIAQMTAPQSSSGTGGDCNSRLQSIIDQLKLLEQLFEEATTDARGLWKKEQKGEIDPSGTTWSGHKKSYEKARKELQDRIKDWEDQCPGMNLDADQREELEMAHDYAKKDFPEKPEYAK